MKFLTDENIAVSVVKFLRSENYDVKDVKEERLFGISDFEVLKIAIKEERIIITHDKDFENISRNRSIEHRGIILIRLFDQSPENVIVKLKEILERKEIIDKIENSVITIREDYVEIGGA